MSFSGDAIVDGRTIKWEYKKRFEGMTEAKIAEMTMKEFEVHEEERMQKNAWLIAEDLANRLDGAPVLSSYIHGLISSKSQEHFFFNKEEVKAYHTACSSAKQNVPGSGYIKKIYDFMESHYEYGDLYMEYLKGTCAANTGILCQYCSATPWRGPAMTRVPRPVPDYEKLPSFHYKPVAETSNQEADGSYRHPDDFMPRVQLRKQFDKGQISCDKTDSLTEFSKTYIVKEEYVLDYVQHLHELIYKKQMRSKQKKTDVADKKNKSVAD